MLGPVFNIVEHPALRVAVIASGPSLAGVELAFPASVTRIGVGAAAEHAEIDAWFTLDPSPVNRRRMRERSDGVVYYAAVPDDYGTPAAACADHRAPAEPEVIFLQRVTGDGHGRFKTKAGLSPSADAIHTGNSAWGALQLAVHMIRAAGDADIGKIALFGVDGGNDGYAWGGGRPRNLEVMPKLFASAVPDLKRLGIAVMNASPTSTVTCFPRVSPGEAMAWLAR
jgi:hypothetical protein